METALIIIAAYFGLVTILTIIWLKGALQLPDDFDEYDEQ
jgi:hypothetical protein